MATWLRRLRGSDVGVDRALIQRNAAAGFTGDTVNEPHLAAVLSSAVADMSRALRDRTEASAAVEIREQARIVLTQARSKEERLAREYERGAGGADLAADSWGEGPSHVRAVAARALGALDRARIDRIAAENAVLEAARAHDAAVTADVDFLLPMARAVIPEMQAYLAALNTRRVTYEGLEPLPAIPVDLADDLVLAVLHRVRPDQEQFR
jgi:hypothetical protein